MHESVAIVKIDISIHCVETTLKMHSLIRNQVMAPVLSSVTKYSWYSSG